MKDTKRPAPVPAARLMTGATAAAYCDLTPGTFANWVAAGRLPQPLPGTRRWDRRAIDSTLDKLSGLTPSIVPDDDPFEAWEREHESAKAAGRRERI
jgi:hypothetical protein